MTCSHFGSKTALERAVLNPDDPEELNQLSLIYEKMGELTKALKYAEQCLKLLQKEEEFKKEENRKDINRIEAGLPRVYKRIGDIYYKLRNNKEALRHYKLSFENMVVCDAAIFLSAHEIRSRIVETCLELGDYDQAIAHASQAIKEATNCGLWANHMNWKLAPFYYWLGIAYQHSGNSRLGRKHLIMYITILELMSELSNDSYSSEIAEGYIAMGNFDKAIELFDQAVDDDLRKNRTSGQDSPSGLYTIKSAQMVAMAYEKKQRFLEAIALYQAIFNRMCEVSDEPCSELANVVASIGRCYLAVDNIEKALKAIRMSVKILDKIFSVDAKLNQVIVLIELRDYYASKQDSKNQILYFNQARTIFESLNEEESQQHTVYQKLKKTFEGTISSNDLQRSSPSLEFLSSSTSLSSGSETTQEIGEEIDTVQVFLDKFGFGHRIATCGIGDLILMKMMKRSFTELVFKGCWILNHPQHGLKDDYFLPILQRSANSLKRLDLTQVTGIKGRHMSFIAQHCTQLQKLYLNGCTELDLIENWGIVYSTPLRFPQLKILQIKNTPKLKRINIDAPKLKVIEASPETTHNLKQVTINTPALETFPYLENQAIFGLWGWTAYFGNIGPVPPLPPNIGEILRSPCPFFPGLSIFQTHELVLMPKSIDNRKYNLMTLSDLVKNPKRGHKLEEGIVYNNAPEWFIRGNSYKKEREYANRLASANRGTYWCLITTSLVPESLGKTRKQIEGLLGDYSRKSGQFQYRLPTSLEFATFAAKEFVVKNVRILRRSFGESLFALSFCYEKEMICDAFYTPVMGGYWYRGRDRRHDENEYHLEATFPCSLTILGKSAADLGCLALHQF